MSLYGSALPSETCCYMYNKYASYRQLKAVLTRAYRLWAVRVKLLFDEGRVYSLLTLLSLANRYEYFEQIRIKK